MLKINSYEFDKLYNDKIESNLIPLEKKRKTLFFARIFTIFFIRFIQIVGILILPIILILTEIRGEDIIPASIRNRNHAVILRYR